MTTENILSFFREIMLIPRESGNEQHIIAYLQDFAKKHNLACKTDEVGNVLIVKEATKGMEKAPTIILQSHSDMVCEKNSGIEHDFAKDPIQAVVEDGWLIAKDTTLGADCGIGIAAQLAILASKDAKHGKIESLFTISEETGMDGAFGLKPDFLTGSIFINLDSEDEGELFIGCAGGIDTSVEYKYSLEQAPKDIATYTLKISGGIGGHSGDDIDKERANAVQLLARFLNTIIITTGKDLYRIFDIDGGNKRNAIAREASATISFDQKQVAKVIEEFEIFLASIKDEYSISDSNITASFEATEISGKCLDKNTSYNLTKGLIAVPHGVLAMSSAVKGLVETSTNLASVKNRKEENLIFIGTSQRSAINSSRRFAGDRIEAAFQMAGATKVSHESEYPGWKPKLDSPILEISKKAYIDLFHTEPIVRAIHAGLECGLILEKYPDLDMISFGPTIKGVHAPGERLDLASLEKFTLLLNEVITNCK